MAHTIVQKLRIKENYLLLTVNAPSGFQQQLGELPSGVVVGESLQVFNQIHWFVTSKSEVDKGLQNIVSLLEKEFDCWIYYPKGTSKLQTDLTRDKGWEALSTYQHLKWISLISFDETWSAFGMRLKSEKDKASEAAPKKREIFSYIDASTKTIRLPDGLKTALGKVPDANQFFNELSFTNKKEYVEWIVTAKREDTKASRIKQTIIRLGKGWKNPANR